MDKNCCMAKSSSKRNILGTCSFDLATTGLHSRLRAFLWFIAPFAYEYHPKKLVATLRFR